MVRNPPNTASSKGKGQCLGVVTKRLWEHVSGSIPETEVSPVKQDTDVAPDIGRVNHDYSCASNTDSR